MARIGTSRRIGSGLIATNGETLVSRELARVTTPFREAERFLAYVRAVLTQAQDAARAISAIPTFFDIDSAVGEPLTLLGKRLGFPRCHCVCDATPVYGIACDGGTGGPVIAGLCEDAVFRGCGGISDLCLNDDEVYRAHLVARRYQMLRLYDITSLGTALRAIWGPTAWVPEARRGQVVIAPGRDLTVPEQRRLSVSLRVLPIAPTMEIAVHYGGDRILGVGTGWAGMCEGVVLCPIVVDPYACEVDNPQAYYGIEGPDDGPITAGMGDEDATFLGCA